MLVLARPHIIATYRTGILQGTTLVTVLSTIIVLVTSVIMLSFIVDFAKTIR